VQHHLLIKEWLEPPFGRENRDGKAEVRSDSRHRFRDLENGRWDVEKPTSGATGPQVGGVLVGRCRREDALGVDEARLHAGEISTSSIESRYTQTLVTSTFPSPNAACGSLGISLSSLPVGSNRAGDCGQSPGNADRDQPAGPPMICVRGDRPLQARVGFSGRLGYATRSSGRPASGARSRAGPWAIVSTLPARSVQDQEAGTQSPPGPLPEDDRLGCPLLDRKVLDRPGLKFSVGYNKPECST